MKNTNIDFIVNIAKLYTVLSKELDSKLWGIWLTDFIVLFYLNKAELNKLRRIDLAEKVWLTASGITRLLLPMEKIGLVSRETDKYDARVSFVLLTKAWKEMFINSFKRAEEFTDPLLPKSYEKRVGDTINLMTEVWSKILLK